MPRLLFLMLLVTVISCTKQEIADFTNFDVVDNSETILVACNSVNSTIEVFSSEIIVDDAKYTGNKTKKNLIAVAQLNEARLIIAAPSYKTFDFLKEVELYITAKNLPEKKIASLYGIPDNISNQISLNADMVDVKNYLAKDKYQFKLRMINDKAVNEPIKIKISSKFQVDAKKSH